jgi:hypothetical protein
LLLEIGRIEPIRGYDESLLSIHTPDVLARIQNGDPSWEEMVPAKVAEIIKAKSLFGWQPARGHRRSRPGRALMDPDRAVAP